MPLAMTRNASRMANFGSANEIAPPRSTLLMPNWKA